jgi:6-phosphogluconolactonase
VDTLPEGYDEESYCADVHVHPSGEWLYGSNRGHDSIAIFEIDEDTGRLDAVGHESTRGHWPRNFAIDPTGGYLYAENRRSDSVVTFAIDADSGELTPTGDQLELPEPLCMGFVEC